MSSQAADARYIASDFEKASVLRVRRPLKRRMQHSCIFEVRCVRSTHVQFSVCIGRALAQEYQHFLPVAIDDPQLDTHHASTPESGTLFDDLEVLPACLRAFERRWP